MKCIYGSFIPASRKANHANVAGNLLVFGVDSFTAFLTVSQSLLLCKTDNTNFGALLVSRTCLPERGFYRKWTCRWLSQRILILSSDLLVFYEIKDLKLNFYSR